MSWVRVLSAVFLFALVLTICASHPARAAGESKSQQPRDDVVFVPPDIGAPKDRMGAGTRSTTSDQSTDTLQILVPDGGGLTTLSSPPLIWRLPRGHRGDLTIALTPVSGGGAELTLRGPFPPGNYGLDLARSGFEMETGRIYELTVTLLVTTSGTAAAREVALIERVPESMRASNPAAAGLWFDALAQLSEIGLSGRVRVLDPDKFDQLLSTAGVTQ